MDQTLKARVVNVKRIRDKIIAGEAILGEESMNIDKSLRGFRGQWI